MHASTLFHTYTMRVLIRPTFCHQRMCFYPSTDPMVCSKKVHHTVMYLTRKRWTEPQKQVRAFNLYIRAAELGRDTWMSSALQPLNSFKVGPMLKLDVALNPADCSGPHSVQFRKHPRMEILQPPVGHLFITSFDKMFIFSSTFKMYIHEQCMLRKCLKPSLPCVGHSMTHMNKT